MLGILCHPDDKADWVVIHMSEDETYFSHNGKIMFFLEYSVAPTEMHQKCLSYFDKRQKKLPDFQVQSE